MEISAKKKIRPAPAKIRDRETTRARLIEAVGTLLARKASRG